MAKKKAAKAAKTATSRGDKFSRRVYTQGPVRASSPDATAIVDALQGIRYELELLNQTLSPLVQKHAPKLLEELGSAWGTLDNICTLMRSSRGR